MAGRNHVFNDHPPKVVIEPVPRGWEWTLRSDFGDDEEAGYKHAYWFFDGDWKFHFYNTAGGLYRDNPCRGTKRTLKGAEKAGRKALKRLTAIVRHLEGPKRVLP